MVHNLLTGLAVTLYWSSYPVIGLATVLAIQRWITVGRALTAAAFVADTPILVQFLLMTGIGWAVMAPFVLIGYALSLPIAWLMGAYLAVLTLSVMVLVVARRELLVDAVKAYHSLRNEYPVAVLMVVLMILFVALASFRLGGFLADGTDSFVHMAKISQIAYGHFTIADPILNHTIESRYHINIFHALNALPVRFYGVAVYTVWRQSLIFFGILAYAALYAVAWWFAPKNWRRGYPVLVAAVAMLATASFWRTAGYPNEVVLAWISIYLVGLSWFLKSKNPLLMLMAALLAALTHPTYSLMVFAYTLLFGLILFVFWRLAGRTISNRKGAYAALVCVIALFPVAVPFFFPDRMTGASFNFASGGLLSIQHYGPFKVMALPIALNHSWSALTLMAFGLAGLVWLIVNTTVGAQKLLVITLASFYALVAYNPIFIAIFSKQLPPWLLQRFSSFDRISAMTTVLGALVGIVWLCGRWIKSDRWRFVVATVVTFGVFMPKIITETRILLSENNTQLPLLQAMTQVEPSLDGQVVFASSGLSFMVPSVAHEAHVIWMPETNASPVANMALRKRCGQALQVSLREADLRQAGVTRVLIGAWEAQLKQLARQKPYLHQIDASDSFLVYEVAGMNPVGTSKTCNIPNGE